MSVYVDSMQAAFGRMVMCHMWADTEAELLAMADTIGVDRKWIQGHPTLSHGKHRNASWVHFDIAKGKRALAVQHGAIETDKYGPLEFEARRDIASASAEVNRRGIKRLEQIASVRAQRAEFKPEGDR